MGLFGKKYQYEIGILFDIDDLGGGFYGREAYRILFRSLDPQQMKYCFIRDGDTNSTLAGADSVYCIAIQATRRKVITYVRDALGKRTDSGFQPLHRRFIEGNVVEREPLVLAGGVGRTGVFSVRENDMVQPSWAEGTAWQVVVIGRP